MNASEKAYWAMHGAIYERQQDSEAALDDAHLLEYVSRKKGAQPFGRTPFLLHTT